MRDRLTAIIAIVLLLLLIIASYWYSLKSTYGGLRYIPSESSPDFIATNITLMNFDQQGTAKSRLQAADMKHFSNDSVFFVDPRLATVSPNEPVIRAQANQGQSIDGGATFQFEGDVQIIREADKQRMAARLQSSAVEILTDKNIFQTDHHVTITHGQDRIEGDGMIYNNLDQTLLIKNNVRTKLHPNNSNQRNLLLPQ